MRERFCNSRHWPSSESRTQRKGYRPRIYVVVLVRYCIHGPVRGRHLHGSGDWLLAGYIMGKKHLAPSKPKPLRARAAPCTTTLYACRPRLRAFVVSRSRAVPRLALLA
eukprot:8047372-Alexandrium_andersonii.AAC.1